ncbi:MAG TPA: thioredoxin domain-containing protein [Thermoplasmata archaeon]|nr:thioredoxin domain-containing protein [Thermoplasmata archaeon]
MPPTSGPPERRGGWRLAKEPSAYLKEAAEQPIDWHPWGPEPFDLARRSNRPILLDIGASWCHWCHVMDEGTYSDPDVARLLSQFFVAVKVDRDQHPEVDRRYQRQVGALTGEGGWPLTGFLTPDGEVFLGGTYFPPSDGYGRPGFRRVLKEVARLWKEEPERIRENAKSIQAALERMRSARTSAPAEFGEFISSVRAAVLSSYDPVHGGFGMAPKFPHPTAVSFLLWDSFAHGTASSLDRARDTLRRMADGGMYDQIGGGFHRYSVDEGWHVPHFEKMGVDNAALLSVYVEGARRIADPRFEEIVRGTLGWVRGTLKDPDGGFGASQDADNAPGDDGNYFTWTRGELKQLLDGDEFRFATRIFGVGTDARMPHDPERNVLFRSLSPSEATEGLSLADEPARTLDRVVQTLRTARDRRPTPAVDRAIYSDINGRFIGAFAQAGALLGDAEVLGDARSAADRLLLASYRPGRGMAHRLDSDGPRGFGLLEDQVAFASGLLELAGTTAEPRYLLPAIELLELVDREFRGEDGLLRDVAPSLYDGPKVGGVLEPSYPLEDTPHISANASAALAFLRVGSLTHEGRWHEKATALLRPIVDRLLGAGLFGAGTALAVGLSETDPATVVIEGSGTEAERLRRAAHSLWYPNLWVFDGHPPPPFALPSDVPMAEGSRPRALVCFGSACAPPVHDPADLKRVLARGAPTSG